MSQLCTTTTFENHRSGPSLGYLPGDPGTPSSQPRSGIDDKVRPAWIDPCGDLCMTGPLECPPPPSANSSTPALPRPTDSAPPRPR
jgi:hypothetical protein